MRGLRSIIKLFVKAGKPSTIREPQNSALETEKEKEISRVVCKKPNFENKRNPNPNKSNNAIKTNQEHFRSNTQRITTDNKKRFPCHGCGCLEHFIRDCPRKPSSSSFPSRQQPNVPNPIKYTECREIHGTQEQASCLVNSKFGQRSHSVLADTGAAVNVIKLKDTSGLKVRKTSAQLIGINNNTPVSCNQECKIDQDGVEHIFLVVPNNFPLEEDGIAGRPFLEKEDVIILAKQKKNIFNQKIPQAQIFKFSCNYLKSRSNLLKSNTRINHILNEKERNQLWDIIDSYQDVFCLPGDSLPLI